MNSKSVNISLLREKTIKALANRAKGWGDEVCDNDYVLDLLYRNLSNLPDRPEKSLPLVGFFPQQPTFKKLFNGITVPEKQLNVNNYVHVTCPVLGNLTLTGGFMEPHGHSWKSQKIAIFGSGNLQYLTPANRNLGIDYVTPQIRAWYNGICTDVRYEKGYGNRAYFEWDVEYEHNGDYYKVRGAFAHAASFSVKTGDCVKQGQLIGFQGSTGGNYPPHIDYRQWIHLNSQVVDLSPNALEKQIHG